MSNPAGTTSVQTVPKNNEVEYVPFGSEDKVKLSTSIIKTYVAIPTKSGKLPDDRECIRFMMLCRSRKLNPFEGDCFLQGYDGKNGPEFSLITAHQAFLKRAEVHPEFDGMDSGVIVLPVDSDTPLEREGDFLHKDDQLIGGWAIVYFKQRKHPMKRRLNLSTFVKPHGRWNDDPAGMIVKCFDPETEVLTTRGFEKFANAEGRILQVTEHGLEATDSVPFVQNYAGEMVEHCSRNGNFLVTLNHDMPIAMNGEPEAKMEARELLKLRQRDVATMPLTIIHTAPECPIADNIIQLAAAYIADGSDNSVGSGFSISVSRKDKITRLLELGMHTSLNHKNDAGRTATLSTGRIITTRDNKISFYYSRTPDFTALVGRDKQINHETVLKLSMRQARILIDTWTDYDGHCPAKMRRGRVFTSRPHHVRSLELIAVVAGYSINKPPAREVEGGKTGYSITPTDRTNVRLKQSSLKSVMNQSGKVWCVTVPTHKIVVRRNGFSFVSYQCAEADALRSSFPTMLGGLYADVERGPVIDVGPGAKAPDFGPELTKLPAPAKPAAPEPAKEPAGAPAVPEGAKTPPQPQKPAGEVPGARESGKAAEGVSAGNFTPNPNETEACQNLRFLMAKSGISEPQVLAYAKENSMGEKAEVTELSDAKLLALGKAWSNILPKLRQQ